jgi:hypothetical protein
MLTKKLRHQHCEYRGGTRTNDHPRQHNLLLALVAGLDDESA